MLSNNELSGPLAPKQLNEVTEAIKHFSSEQKIWLSGYLAGQSQAMPNIASQHISQIQLTVLFGSQTGNAKLLAEDYAVQAESQGISVALASLADYKPRQIVKEKNLVLLISTHGEGDAPDDAEIFFEYIFSDKAPKLNALHYSVLALGDSSYEKFCQTGIDIDQQFKKLGAQQIVQRVECDLDYEDKAKAWQQNTLKHYLKDMPDNAINNNVSPLSLLKSNGDTNFNRNNTYTSEILAIQKITTENSIKNTYHIELSIEDSGIKYEAGDSLGIMATNNPKTVMSLITWLHLTAEEIVSHKGERYTLRDVLTNKLEITLLNKLFLKFYAKHTKSIELTAVTNNQEAFNNYVSNRQLLDVLQEYPAKLSAQQLVDNLIKITPRLYSISSSLTDNPDEVHLTVSLVESSQLNANNGLVSGLLCAQSQVGDTINVYVEHNRNFKIPNDPDTSMIMIGAGTGIAPYRAFLQERQTSQASGKNWLFFGNPSYENDFLYQLELQKFKKSNILNHIDVAFSRDQQEKIYVQHRIKQQAAEIWQWLAGGAHLYICGNADHMAKDVEYELLALIRKYGNKNNEEAQNHLSQLKRNNRYQKDVY